MLGRIALNDDMANAIWADLKSLNMITDIKVQLNLNQIRVKPRTIRYFLGADPASPFCPQQ